MRVVFLTGHAPDAPRKTGFHFWMEILAARGVEVDWITLGFSALTKLTRKGSPYPAPYNQWVQLSPRTRKFIWVPLFHPVKLGHALLNKLALPFFNLYPQQLPQSLRKDLQGTDLFIVEVGSGLMMIPFLAKLYPQAKFIYFVADRPRTVGAHQAILDAEQKALAYFSLIRVPAIVMKSDYPSEAPVQYIPQGLAKDVFDRVNPSPYTKSKNVISIGDMRFDAAVIETMAEQFPDWSFHLFGKKAKLTKPLANVVEYGERPFGELVPYIQHADFGLAAYRPGADSDYLAQSSLKIMQYTYCRLPILAPDSMVQNRPHIIGYDRDDAGSIVRAFNVAKEYDHAAISTSHILGWNEVLDKMLASLS